MLRRADSRVEACVLRVVRKVWPQEINDDVLPSVTRHRVKYGPLYYPFMVDPAHEPAGKNRLMKRMPKSWW